MNITQSALCHSAGPPLVQTPGNCSFNLLNLALLRKGRYVETCITVYVRERQAFGAFTMKTYRDLASKFGVSSVGEFVSPY
jgi:hypothetical protein